MTLVSPSLMALVGVDLTLVYAFLTRAGLLYRLYTQPNTSPHNLISTEMSPTTTLAMLVWTRKSFVHCIHEFQVPSPEVKCVEETVI